MEEDTLVSFEKVRKLGMTAAELRQLQADLPLLLESIDILAQLIRAKFDALKNQGFSDHEALELCKG